MEKEKPLYELLDVQSKRIRRDIKRITVKNDRCRDFIEDVTSWAKTNNSLSALSIQTALETKFGQDTVDLSFQEELNGVAS